ncbi:hypothetical protein [Shinella sp.]|uniref:hypothetical protein n=1 Tax=Shinella sp. TaxID=1870904 RepID=UPI0029B85C62|nr:hypothetical protein [Shinella sp.]MDX3973487.1 hypothetical protein [Shinella sp.]
MSRKEEAEIERALIESYERLKRSGALYDIGHHSEAPDIAKEVYIIAHDRGGSHVSLLTALGIKEKARFVDSSNQRHYPPERGILASSEYILIGQHITFSGIDYVPNLERNGYNNNLPFTEWKDGHVLSRHDNDSENLREFISREEIYTYVRNNEGGGHVNPRLSTKKTDVKMINLMKGSYVDGYMHLNEGPAVTSENFMPAYATIRQIGWEIEKTLENNFPAIIAKASHAPTAGPRMKLGTR